MILPKVSLPLHPPEDLTPEERANWYRQRNFVICPIILVTTISKECVPNAAVKTDFMTVGSMKRYAFSCDLKHHTSRNILDTQEFVVNIPTENIVSKVLKAAIITAKPCPPGVNEIEKAGLTPIPSEKVKPPRIKECVAHYECILDWYKAGIFAGKVVAVSVDESLMEGEDNRKMMFVGGGRSPSSYGVVGKTKKWPKISV